MLDERKKVLALIPARGGSKGIKNKNIIDVAGKPLISYTIMAANASEYVDEVIVTTDSEEIAAVSMQYGAKVPFLRPAELAGDYSTTLDAVMHAVEMLKEQKFDVLVLLQPTSPLRTTEDIDNALRTFLEKDCKGLASVSEVNDSPILMRTISEGGLMNKMLDRNSTVRRQDMPIVYRVNGSIYINLIKEISKDTSFNDNPVAYVMNKEHSLDIDEYVDLVVAEYYLQKSTV